MRPRSSSNVSPRTPSTIISDALAPFYLPHCIVLVSSHPYWATMHELVSIIYDEILQKNIEPSSIAYQYLIQKYAFHACNTPIPPMTWERIALSFYLKTNHSVLTFDPPIHINRSILDLDLSTLLLTLNIGKLLDVLAAIFTQQPIIFFSSNYSKLVITLECLLYLVYPLKWIHIYIPIVPDSLRDYYLEGPPGSYIMGVHARHQLIVEQLNTSFVCNLDDDKNIHIPSDIEFYRIPPSKLRRFIGPITNLVEHIKNIRSLQNVQAPVLFRIDKQRELERQHRVETNEKIIEIFLDLMVDLCDDTLKPIYWKMDYQTLSSRNSIIRSSVQNQTKFSKEKYLLSKMEGVEQEFYRLFIETTAFQLFIEEEITAKTPSEFQKICQLRSQLNHDQPYHFNTKLTDNQVSK